MVEIQSFNQSRSNKSELPQPIPHDEYDPFAHRSVEKPTSSFGSFIHLVKTALGIGVLSMPMAFKYGGYIFGLIATTVSGIICTHCVYLLVETSHKICKKTKTPSMGFGETAEMVFAHGPQPFRKFSFLSRKVCEIGIIVTHFGVCCVYILLMAGSFQGVVNKELDLDWNIRIYIVFAMIACIFIGQIRVLKYLVPCSSIANILILLVLGITFYLTFDQPIDYDHRNKFTSWEHVPSFFSIVIFAMEGVGAIMPIENQMKNPQHFLGWRGVLNLAMLVVIAIYTTIGYFGYMRFGDAVRGSITLNLPLDHVLSKVVQYLIGFGIYFTFGLVFYVPIDITWRQIEPKVDKKKRNVVQTLYRIAVILGLGCIGMAVPNLDPYISLLGAICMSILGLLVPAAIHALNEWPNTGRFHMIFIKDIVLCIAGLFVLVVGTWVSVVNIITIYT